MDARHWIDKIMLEVDVKNDWVWLYVIIMLFAGFLIMFSPMGNAAEFDVMTLNKAQIEAIFKHIEDKKPSGKVKRRFIV